MKVAAFIANRIAFNQQRSFSRFIIRLSITATVISVAVMIITLAFTNGFQVRVSQKIFSFWGHIRIQEKQPYKAIISEETPLSKNDALEAEIKRNPDVQSIHAFATKYVMLKTKDDIGGVLVKGVDSSYDFRQFSEFMQPGSRMITFKDSGYSRDIILSSFTAGQLHLKVNDRIMVHFFRSGQDQPGQDVLTVAGIFKTGIAEYDELFALGDIKLIRRMNLWSQDKAGGYEIFLKDYKKIDRVYKDIYEMSDFPGTWDTQSVRNISPNIFDWLSMQDQTRTVLIILMVAVAVINLITCLIILVLERIRMIGVLKALGASNLTVQMIFLRHALIITLTGIIIGTGLAIAVLVLQQKTGFIKLKEEAYYLNTAAVEISPLEILFICGLTFAICLLILLIPTVLVRKIQPVRAIQFR